MPNLSVDTIFKNAETKHGLTLFEPQDIAWVEQQLFEKAGKPYLRCLVKDIDRPAKPEEIVRQLYLRRLLTHYNYPKDRIDIESEVHIGVEKKRADIVIYDKDQPTARYIIVEVKKPKRADGKEQLRSYCHATGAPIGVWTNGIEIEFWHRRDPNYFEPLLDIPGGDMSFGDFLNKPFTLNDLMERDKKEAQTQPSLKDLIKDMEDEVLAKEGVDVFEEVFKLIFAKIYDEWKSGNEDRNSPRPRNLQFRNVGTEKEVKDRVEKLFEAAKKKWEKVFPDKDVIELTPSALATCVAFLEDRKLLNSNLDLVDEAFEYLINKTSKGEKGQYFTSRWVIDMAVKMLNPKEHEFMIDTAAGSSGFTVHTIFHVWEQILRDMKMQVSHLFTSEDKPARCTNYVQEKVFAIDFDPKAVRVARCLNLIAGDGQTNVLELNTLDWERWKDKTEDQTWQDAYFDGFKRLRKLQADKHSFRNFGFQVLMANPPFAGDLTSRDARIIHKYEIAKNEKGKFKDTISRHILFVERNLEFLKPGGRMAVVLPQGVYNNSSDKFIRDFIARKCRILAVVGLHGNTFKPHTGTKTSVLFVQKWNDDPHAGDLCPYAEDYNIFFATQQTKGKDNSGDKIFAKDADGNPLLDKHGHRFVEHDLFSVELADGERTPDGIAEAFIEFAKKEKLSFFP
jgi:type I restriction enzyme M protein